MKHRLTFIFLSVVAAICLCFGSAACGEQGDEQGNEQGGGTTVEKTAGTEGLEYTFVEGGTLLSLEMNYEESEPFYICSGIGTATATEIEIASWYNGKWVKAIYYEAFEDCTSLTSITIPDSVIHIGDSVFENCSSLESITLPDSVIYIGDSAFENCSSLESITLPDDVKYIGDSAFSSTAYYNNESNWENDVLYIGKHLIKAKTSLSGAYEIKNSTLTIAVYAITQPQ